MTTYLKAFIAYLYNAFGISPDTTVTIFITVFVFIVGFLLRRISIWLSSFFARRKLRKILKITVMELSKETNKQSIAFKKTSNEFSFSNSNAVFNFRKSPISATSIIINTGYNSFYEAYFTGFENSFKCKQDLRFRCFYKLWTSSNNVVYWLNRSDEQKITEKYSNYLQENNRCLIQLRKYLEAIYTEFQANNQKFNKNSTEYVIKVDKIHKHWQELENRTNHKVSNEELVKKLYELNQEYQNLIFANEMNNILLESIRHFNDQSNYLNSQRKQYEDYSRIFKNYSRYCNLAVKVLG